jgi:hypothetical protein
MAAAAIMLAAGSQAQARLGWTLDDCQTKWGAPVKVNYDAQLHATHYIFNGGSGLFVQIDLLVGRAHSVTYWSKTKSFLAKNANELLQRNYAGNWNLYDDGLGKKTFATWQLLADDGSVICYAIFERLLSR